MYGVKTTRLRLHRPNRVAQLLCLARETRLYNSSILKNTYESATHRSDSPILKFFLDFYMFLYSLL